MPLKFKKSEDSVIGFVLCLGFACISGIGFLLSILKDLFFSLLIGATALFSWSNLIFFIMFIGTGVGSLYFGIQLSRNRGVEVKITPEGLQVTRYERIVENISWSDVARFEYTGETSRKLHGRGSRKTYTLTSKTVKAILF